MASCASISVRLNCGPPCWTVCSWACACAIWALAAANSELAALVSSSTSGSVLRHLLPALHVDFLNNSGALGSSGCPLDRLDLAVRVQRADDRLPFGLGERDRHRRLFSGKSPDQDNCRNRRREQI